MKKFPKFLCAFLTIATLSNIPTLAIDQPITSVSSAQVTEVTDTFIATRTEFRYYDGQYNIPNEIYVKGEENGYHYSGTLHRTDVFCITSKPTFKVTFEGTVTYTK